jgi:hypothetical protein
MWSFLDIWLLFLPHLKRTRHDMEILAAAFCLEAAFARGA